MLLQRSQSLIHFVRIYCLNDIQAEIISIICRNFDFVDDCDRCEDGTYVFVTRAIPFGRPELKRHRTTSPTIKVG